MKDNIPTVLKNRLNPRKKADKEWFLALLDEDIQRRYEDEHLKSVLAMLKIVYILPYQKKIRDAKEEIAAIRARGDYSAEDYREILGKNEEIAAATRSLNAYKCFFSEPYFARMDVVDDAEGYNSYYIGKKGDVNLEIVDWRAPLAVRYYQKSRVNFTINEYEYHTILRRALSVKNGKVLDFRNEYLSVREYLTPEEIAGRDEEILFDPFLRQIIKSRKDDFRIQDIIRTIQEKQFAIITLPERESFVLQGCAGSGKTMILLHRLSYLMYNNENLRPRDVLVITPSDSFNAFIDELSQVLELQKVRTVTLQSYFFQALATEGIDLTSRLGKDKEPAEYLEYLYSSRFIRDTKSRLDKIYDGIYGLFTGRECRDVAEKIVEDCRRQKKVYDRVKNASVRIRRTVLGEMKENKEGGFYFTKPFRSLMAAMTEVEDFLAYALEGKIKSADYFYRQFVGFYRSAHFVARYAERIISQAQDDLRAFEEVVEKEIVDLKRYKQKRGTEEIYTYAERIARRNDLKKESQELCGQIAGMSDGSGLLHEFFDVMRLSRYCAAAGKCENAVDIARWLYRETIKKYKSKYGMKGIYPSDGYALCFVLAQAGRQLSPRFGLVFIDEGQDISEGEYALLKRIHSDAAFNIFGDLKQNITPYRGVKDWKTVTGGNVYELNQNYRNTNQIVDFVSGILDVDMRPIGYEGAEVQMLKMRGVSGFFREKQGLKAVIAKEEYLPLFDRRGYHLLGSDGKISKSRINVMSVYESKGLEFSAVAVYDKDMTENEKYIAYTRALRELAVVRD